MGLALARELKTRFPGRSVCVLEKEKEVGLHASGRNSGVLHAGFYYSADSLKAKFTKDGNAEMKKFCREKGIPVNECRKVVVAQSEDELESLYELEKRGIKNGVEVKLVDEKELASIDKNVRTVKWALFSPTTATVNPVDICQAMQSELLAMGVEIRLGVEYRRKIGEGAVAAGDAVYEAGMIVNCAGLYADKVAHDFGFADEYVVIPFKGIYLKYHSNDKPVSINVYPVPNLKNPFLGVHFTITADNAVKIGPTAIPAFWRENYAGMGGFNAKEMWETVRHECALFAKNSFGFRDLAVAEIRKYNKRHLAKMARNMVYAIDENRFTEWTRPGIRAQLLNTRTSELVQDFMVAGDRRSVHILNAVSPAFTCSLPFTRWVAEKFIGNFHQKH